MLPFEGQILNIPVSISECVGTLCEEKVFVGRKAKNKLAFLFTSASMACQLGKWQD